MTPPFPFQPLAPVPKKRVHKDPLWLIGSEPGGRYRRDGSLSNANTYFLCILTHSATPSNFVYFSCLLSQVDPLENRTESPLPNLSEHDGLIRWERAGSCPWKAGVQLCLRPEFYLLGCFKSHGWCFLSWAPTG